MYTFFITITEKHPLAGLLLGAIFLLLVGVIHWNNEFKIRSIKVISTTFYKNEYSGEKQVEGMLMVLTSILLSIGGISFLLSLLHLL